MIIVATLLTLVYVFYGNRKSWTVISLAWSMTCAILFFTIAPLSLETILIATMVFLTFLSGTYYQLYFSKEIKLEEKNSRFLSVVTMASILLLSGSLLMVHQSNYDILAELLSENRLRTSTVFQFVEHYRVWGVVLGAFVVFLFLIASSVRRRIRYE